MLASIFHFSKLCYSFAIMHLCQNEPSSKRFRIQNSAPTRVPEIGALCRTVNRKQAPKLGGVGCMGHVATFPRIKGLPVHC